MITSFVIFVSVSNRSQQKFWYWSLYQKENIGLADIRTIKLAKKKRNGSVFRVVKRLHDYSGEGEGSKITL